MLVRSIASLIFVASSFVLASGQTPNTKSESTEKPPKTIDGARSEKLRDLPFPAGVDLQFIIKEIAKDLDLNVLFDPQSHLENRKVKIELKNVTPAAALKYLLLQEELVSDEVAPGTIIVASRTRATSIPKIGVGLTPLTVQLAEYFRVFGGVLVNTVRKDSPGSRAGLKAGDVITAIDGEVVRGGLDLVRALDNKKEGDVTITIVRDRKEQTISLKLHNETK
ncbi:MAG: S1C family serine protease [Pyrinomonadaceae bacterium]